MRPTATTIPELAKELRLASYSLPSEGDWIFHDGMLMPKNVCSDTASLLEWMADHIALLEYEISKIPLIHQGGKAR